MGGIMRIDQAYCVELARVIDIETAHMEYSAQQKPTRFHFQCADATCRNAMQPTVTATLYDRPNPFDGERTPMQFKWGPGAQHLATCPWEEMRQASMLATASLHSGSPANNQQLKFVAVASSVIVDMFHPGLSTMTAANTATATTRSAVRNLPTTTARLKAYVNILQTQIYHTTFLSTVVASYRALNQQERHQAMLHIAGLGRATYAQHFQRVNGGVPDNVARIYYGGATVVSDATGYRLTFYDKPVVNGTPHRVTLYIGNGMIAKHQGAAVILNHLSALDGQRGEYGRCFAFGTLAPSGRASTLEVKIGSLDHLVIFPEISKTVKTV